MIVRKDAPYVARMVWAAVPAINIANTGLYTSDCKILLRLHLPIALVLPLNVVKNYYALGGGETSS